MLPPSPFTFRRSTARCRRQSHRAHIPHPFRRKRPRRRPLCRGVPLARERRHRTRPRRRGEAEAVGQIYGDKNPEPKRRSTRERSRKRHRDRIAAGLCTRCGRQQVSNGSTVCEPCREARRVSDGERRDKGRKNEASRRRYAHRRAMNACKGRLVYVAGKMQTRRWRRDGEDSDRFSTEILLVPGSWTAPGPPTARPRRKPRRPRTVRPCRTPAPRRRRTRWTGFRSEPLSRSSSGTGASAPVPIHFAARFESTGAAAQRSPHRVCERRSEARRRQPRGGTGSPVPVAPLRRACPNEPSQRIAHDPHSSTVSSGSTMP